MNRSKVVPLFQGEDESRIADLWGAAQTALLQASSDAPRRMLDAGPSEASAAAVAYNEFLAEARERAVMVTLNALGRKDWRELASKHAARDGNKDDERAGGFNESTFPDALLAHAGTISEPEFPSLADRDVWLDRLSAGEFTTLYSEAYMLNTGAAIDPKALPVSAVTRTSDAT